MWAIHLFTLVIGAQAQVNMPFDQYLTGLGDALKANGMNILSNALGAVNGSQTGAALLDALYRGPGFMIYGPVDAAWDGVSLDDVSDDDLANILSYHVSTWKGNITNVAPARQKTVLFSLLDDADTLLPDGQTQVCVLETAPNTTDSTVPTVFIRGPDWNATSISYTKNYENINVQAIDRILELPKNLMNTLNTPLADPAPQGLQQAATIITSLALNQTLEECVGCTFFMPVDAAFTSVQDFLDGLDDVAKRAVMQNHVLNGSTVYSPSLEAGDTFVTASGSTLAYASNSSGAFLFGNGGLAKFIRTDIPIQNGVLHLIDAVFQNTETNQLAAQQAESSASQANADDGATLAGVKGSATSLARPDPTTTSPGNASASPEPSNAATVAVVPWIKMGVLSTLFGLFWL